MKKSLCSRVAGFATAGALFAACGMAQAQTVLWTNGRPVTVQNVSSSAINFLGLSSGEPLSATSLQRWYAQPFSLAGASVVTELDVDGFVPTGNEFSQFGFAIWRRTGTNAPTQADEVVRSGVGTTQYIPLVAGVQDPRIPPPNGATFLFKLVLPAPVNLPAGDYYASVWGNTATGTAGFPNFAWFINTQLDTTQCPMGTPIVISDPTNGVHGYRSANYPSPGIITYTGLTGVWQGDPAPPYGPVPQDPQYIYNVALQVLGTGSQFTGACCMPTGGCQIMTAAACCGAGGLYKGNNVSCANANCPLAGACCKTDGTCSVTTQASCTSNLGDYQGDNTSCGSCPPQGACCLENGTCVLSYNLSCTSQGGLYRGNGVPCGGTVAACAPFGFTGDDINTDVGDTIATATPVNGYGERLSFIHGYIGLGDRGDIYKIQICDRSTFNASTVGHGNALDTELALFDRTGKGLVFDDDTGNGTTQTSSQSIITGQFVPSNGYYYLAVTEFNNTTGIQAASLPLDSSGNPIWTEPSPANGTTGGAGWPEWAPNGTSPTQVLATAEPTFSQDPDTFGTYTVALTGACFLGCYANCDGSTTPPILNANDFQCFLNAYAGSLQPGMFPGYANCDSSTAAPILNANDFQCFLNAYAAGCNS